MISFLSKFQGDDKILKFLKLPIVQLKHEVTKKNNIPKEIHLHENQNNFEYFLRNQDGNLQILKVKGQNGIYKTEDNLLEIDFTSSELNYKRKVGYTKSSPFIQIFHLNNQVPKILDCTAGVGKDSFILASFGYNVTMIERNPVIFELLNNGIERGLKDPEVGEILNRMKLIHQDSKEFLTKTEEIYDFIYLDPMFPPARKDIKPKISIQYLRGVVGYDDEKNFQDLINLCCKKSKKVIIKRPDNISSYKLLTYSIKLKDTRYDCIENKF